jgi:hypothetical protein
MPSPVANSQALITIGDMSRESLMLLVGELSFARNVNRQYDSRFGISGAKIGSTANIRKPPQYVVGTGAAITTQAQNEQSVPVVLDTQVNISVEFTSSELSLSLDDFSERVLKPSIRQLAAYIDNAGLQKLYKTVYNQVGTPGTPFASTQIFYDAMVKLQDNLAGMGDLKMIVNTESWTKASGFLTNVFAPKSGDDIIKNYVSSALGFDWFMESNIVVHTAGARGAGAVTVVGAGNVGSTLPITGLPLSTAGALKAGDIFTIANVFAVQARTKVTLPRLQQFVVVNDVTSDGAGAASVVVSPAIVTTGAYQNVSVGPAASAAITFAATSAQSYQVGLALHPDAFVLATAPLSSSAAFPENISTVTDEETGLSITVEKFRDGRAGTDLYRFDILFGFSPLRPELACRLAVS